MTHRYLIKVVSKDPKAYVHSENRIEADTFKREGDVIVFYRGDEPVYTISAQWLLTAERID